MVLLAMMFLVMGFTLYDIQINQGEEFYRSSQHKIAETLTAEAARGQIVDRNGQLLVTNRVIYQVTLDLSLMGDAPQRNAALLSLVRAARDAGIEWADSLAISQESPFSFTAGSPYYTVSREEDGTFTTSLTRLGQLALKMKWISRDPTRQPEPVQDPVPAQPEEEEPGLLEKIKRFFTGAPDAPEAPRQEAPAAKDAPLPTAEELLGKMCASFGLKGEGALDPKTTPAEELPALNLGDLNPEDARAAAGVLYELYLREKGVVKWPPYVFAQEVNIDFISRVKELSLPGVVIEPVTVRQYRTSYAAHLLGRVASMSPEEWEYYQTVDEDGDGVGDYNQNDQVGKEGAEQAFESYLRGSPGVRAVERNTAKKIVSETWITEPEPGDNVVLTLDIGLQGFVENLLAASLPKFEQEEEGVGGAACVVLDVKAAELLACASYPTFDLANYSRDFNENAANPLHPFNNRALQGTYAPGSTFKMVTAIAGLQENGEDGKPIITTTTQIRDEGRYTYYPTPQPRCWIYPRGTHGMVNVTKAIEVSCNYFFYDVGRRVGITRLQDYAARFGLGQKTGLELSEAKGVMAGPEYTQSQGGTWYDGSTLSVAIGQESSQFTPVQLANYIATLVNGGTRNAVHLLKEVKSSDFSQVLYTKQPEVLSTIEIQEKNLTAVKAGMLALTTKGSVSQYFSKLPFRVGAKTGTAQVDGQAEDNAVFVGFAPFDDPEVVISLVVEHGGSGSGLGSMAADILSYYFSSRETREEVLPENTLIR